MSIHQIRKGKTYRLRLRLKDGLGNPVTSFTSDYAPTAQVWRGDSQAVIWAPAVVWENVSNGWLILTIDENDTANLEAGYYSYLVQVLTPEGKLVEVYPSLAQSAQLWIVEAPGADTAPSVYGAFEDLLTYVPTLLDVFQPGEDQTNFREQRHQAREWLDDYICILWRNWLARARTNEGYTANVPTVAQIRSYLDADGLEQSSSVVRIVSCYALSRIMRGQAFRTTTPQASSYGEQATYWQNEAFRYARQCVYMIDADDNGDADLEIDDQRVKILDGAPSTWP